MDIMDGLAMGDHGHHGQHGRTREIEALKSRPPMRARELFDMLRACVRTADLPEADRHQVLAELKRLQREEQVRELQPIVFREAARPGFWEIGSGDDVREVIDTTMGIRPAHRAMTLERRSCRELAPDSHNPRHVIRRPVRVTARRWA